MISWGVKSAGATYTLKVNPDFFFFFFFFFCHLLDRALKKKPKKEKACGAGIAQWLEHRTRDWKVAGSNPCWNGGRIFFSRVDFLCWLLFRYPFHPRVTTVARKRSRSFCQKCRWQVTAKHAYTLRMWILLNRASALVTTCSLICQMTSEDIKHQLIIIIRESIQPPKFLSLGVRQNLRRILGGVGPGSLILYRFSWWAIKVSVALRPRKP